MEEKLSKACDARGASMGRCGRYTEPKATIRFRLHRVRIDSGGYDNGGAYWGLGEPLYRAIDDGTSDAKETQEMWTRANNREEAKRKVLLVFPNARFYR